MAKTIMNQNRYNQMNQKGQKGQQGQPPMGMRPPPMGSTSEVLPVANQIIQNEGNWHPNQQNIQVQDFGGETSQIIMFPEQHLDNTLMGQQRPYMTGGEQQEQWQEIQQQQQQFLFPNQIQQLYYHHIKFLVLSKCPH
jgi:hypothetical protein